MEIAPLTLQNFMGDIMITVGQAEGSASSGIASGGHQRTFKGVVLQHNGHWGAQIYANHQRIWLGTFRSERAAAAAYDSAAAKLFGGAGGTHSHHRNFPATEATGYELAFQDGLSTGDVLAMIKDGSYEAKLHEFVRAASAGSTVRPRVPQAAIADRVINEVEGCEVTEMFRKELTPSDVGKLNRLVIPKKHAMRHLPRVPSSTAGDAEEEEVMVEYRDREARAWAFRYCYWKSSQSYVFTKGWNRFVREKRLRAKDVVSFSWCAEREGLRRSYALIDVVKSDRDGAVVDEEVASPAVAGSRGPEEKRLKLFGVWIG